MRRQAPGMGLCHHAPLWNAGEEEQEILSQCTEENALGIDLGRKDAVSKIRVDSL